MPLKAIYDNPRALFNTAPSNFPSFTVTNGLLIVHKVLANLILSYLFACKAVYTHTDIYSIQLSLSHPLILSDKSLKASILNDNNLRYKTYKYVV